MQVEMNEQDIIEGEKNERYKQSRKQITHKIFRKNSVKKLLGDNMYDILFKEEQAQDVITFDIDTQKVKLQYKEAEQDNKEQGTFVVKTKIDP